MIQLRPIYVICMREFIKFFREKSRLLGTLARPVLWLFVVGNGMSALIRPQAGFSYLQFIFPGMIGMTILFSSIFSSISIVWDREFGFMKEMLVAPISRTSIVVGKAISGTLISDSTSRACALGRWARICRCARGSASSSRARTPLRRPR